MTKLERIEKLEKELEKLKLDIEMEKKIPFPYSNYSVDWMKLEPYHFFPEEHIQRIATKLKVICALEQAAIVVNEGWEPDWSNVEESKYSLYYDRGGKPADCFISNVGKQLVTYFKSHEAAMKAYNMLPNDIKELMKK